MKWVTRDFVHLDRVASPWLIKRFVDRDAEFGFVPWGAEHRCPADAIPLALPGAELGPHDAAGTTFQKILAKYRLTDPALHRMARVVAKGVDYVLHDFRPDAGDTDGQIAVGLLGFAEGMLLVNDADARILEASLPVYDALYANFRAHALVAAQGLTLPAHEGRGPTRPTEFLRNVLKAASDRRPD
jgi:hypothetical protein